MATASDKKIVKQTSYDLLIEFITDSKLKNKIASLKQWVLKTIKLVLQKNF